MLLTFFTKTDIIPIIGMDNVSYLEMTVCFTKLLKNSILFYPFQRDSIIIVIYIYIC